MSEPGEIRRGYVTIAGVNGETFEAECRLRIGDAAVTRIYGKRTPTDLWSITHLPTGFRLPWHFIDAPRACAALRQIGHDFDWTAFVAEVALCLDTPPVGALELKTACESFGGRKVKARADKRIRENGELRRRLGGGSA